MIGLTQIKSEVMGTHQHEFIRVAHFVAFLAKWTKPGERWGGAKSLEGKNQAISLQEAEVPECVCGRWGSLWAVATRTKDVVARRGGINSISPFLSAQLPQAQPSLPLKSHAWSLAPARYPTSPSAIGQSGSKYQLRSPSSVDQVRQTLDETGLMQSGRGERPQGPSGQL